MLSRLLPKSTPARVALVVATGALVVAGGIVVPKLATKPASSASQRPHVQAKPPLAEVPLRGKYTVVIEVVGKKDSPVNERELLEACPLPDLEDLVAGQTYPCDYDPGQTTYSNVEVGDTETERWDVSMLCIPRPCIALVETESSHLTLRKSGGTLQRQFVVDSECRAPGPNPGKERITWRLRATRAKKINGVWIATRLEGSRREEWLSNTLNCDRGAWFRQTIEGVLTEPRPRRVGRSVPSPADVTPGRGVESMSRIGTHGAPSGLDAMPS